MFDKNSIKFHYFKNYTLPPTINKLTTLIFLKEMKKLNYYRIFQWVVFAPLLIPLCLVMGALDGIQHTIEKVINQIKVDASS